ncbi:MAG TPA: hypothetical protein VD905_20165 [Flavobacteriales bacterium]|nr:hypothetical protein [Flavobacteriales bacterium]
MESVMTTDHLRYKPQIPDSNTYKIIKNTSGTPVSTSVLEKMNLYRRHDVDYLWVVNSDIEILVYYVNKMVTHPKNTSGK